jgi:hypothetical protein
MMLNTLRSRFSLAAGAATLVGVLAVYATAEPAKVVSADPPDVPSEIQVPAGNKLFLLAHAIGTQNYTCTGAGTWGPAVPAADLFDKHGKKIGTHFGGPTWQYKDGSSVLGTKVAGATVSPDAIDWLLIKKVSTTIGPDGGDRLSDTTYIQRINTTGGLAPAGACVSGTTASVPYTADYYFYCEADDDDDTAGATEAHP